MKSQTNHKTAMWLLVATSFATFGCGCDRPAPQKISQANEAGSIKLNEQKLAFVKKYFVQLAAFSLESSARDFLNGVTESLRVEVQPTQLPDGSQLWRAATGPFITEPEATRALMQAKRNGFENAFIRIEFAEEDSGSIDSCTQNPAEAPAKPDFKQLTSIGGCREPRWSPTGREIAFYRRGAEHEGLYTIGTGGGQHSRIAESEEGFEVTPRYAWSHDGRQIAFVAKELNRKFEEVDNLYVVNKRGTKRTTIMRQLRNEFRVANMMWSPDGSKIAFEADYTTIDPGAEKLTAVLVIDLDWDFSDSGTAGRPRWIRVSNFDKKNRLLGFTTNETVLFLSSSENRMTPHELVSEIWRYDLPERRRSIQSHIQIENCASVALGNGTLVYSSLGHLSDRLPDKVILQNLIDGDKQILLTKELATDDISAVTITDDSDIFFVHNSKLYVHDTKGRKGVIDLHSHPQSFSVSPSGGKICFAIGGDLFSLRIDQ